MYRYIIKRLLLVVPTLVGAAALVFLLMRLIPGDICVVRLGSGGGTFDERAVTACHAQLGLDRPVFLQFVDFVWGFFTGDFGISMWSGKPVAYEIAARFPISLEICILAVVVANLIAIPLGTISALKQNSPIDFVIRVISIAGLATPSFWLGILFILAILDLSQAAFLIGGLVVTEQVFNLNGIGRLFVQSVQNQDYTMTQALVMLVVAVFVLTNTVVDLLYAWLDPRIRYG